MLFRDFARPFTRVQPTDNTKIKFFFGGEEVGMTSSTYNINDDQWEIRLFPPKLRIASAGDGEAD